MNIVTEEFQELVLDDIKTYETLNHPVKAGLLERLLVRQLPTVSLHPNPQDEFCSLSVGPNYGIVSDYAKMFSWLKKGKPLDDNFEKDPLLVEKMSVGGYMILNGHHRWLAARRLHVSKLPVRILNVSTMEDIISAVNSTSRNMCVSFDLDEILLTDGSEIPAHKKLPFPFSRMYRKTLRRNAPVLIQELQRMGFDVWVYSGEYFSEAYIRRLFRLHHVKVDGILIGLRRRGAHKPIREAFSKKYRISLHVDNQDVVCVKTQTREYESFAIDAVHEDWASEVVRRLRENREYWHE